MRLLQPAKAKSPIVATLLGRVTAVMLVQPSNAFCPIAVKLLGSVRLVIEVIFLKASSPIEVTSTPSIVAGITTAPPFPQYPVIVSPPPVPVV